MAWFWWLLVIAVAVIWVLTIVDIIRRRHSRSAGKMTQNVPGAVVEVAVDSRPPVFVDNRGIAEELPHLLEIGRAVDQGAVWMGSKVVRSLARHFRFLVEVGQPRAQQKGGTRHSAQRGNTVNSKVFTLLNLHR